MKNGLLPKQRRRNKKVKKLHKSKKRKYARNTYATPVFAGWWKDWESEKTSLLLQMLARWEIKHRKKTRRQNKVNSIELLPDLPVW